MLVFVLSRHVDHLLDVVFELLHLLQQVGQRLDWRAPIGLFGLSDRVQSHVSASRHLVVHEVSSPAALDARAKLEQLAHAQQRDVISIVVIRNALANVRASQIAVDQLVKSLLGLLWKILSNFDRVCNIHLLKCEELFASLDKTYLYRYEI